MMKEKQIRSDEEVEELSTGTDTKGVARIFAT